MKVYVATSWSNRIEAVAIAEYLEALGHTITQKWWDYIAEDNNKSQDDLHGVLECDLFLLVTTEVLRGGLVEFGMALATGKRIILVGDGSHNVFYSHPSVEHFGNIHGALQEVFIEV